mmetsp:Transcript_8553/g.14932  ORF Transcript_8553/g.14932 Transcript_8553/m.14932 type:complete len:201 (+) Transcript_8553:133-735(+)
MGSLYRDFVQATQLGVDKAITTYQDYFPQEAPEPDLRGLFPVGFSTMIMKEENLCHSAHCRLQVARSKGGDYAFAVDRNGFHWKCVNRQHIDGDPGRYENWACIPLSCFKKEGTILKGFKFEEDCKKPAVVVNDDGAVVEDAPEDAEEYPPIELLKPPLRPDEMSMPSPLLLVAGFFSVKCPPLTWSLQRRQRNRDPQFL